MTTAEKTRVKLYFLRVLIDRHTDTIPPRVYDDEIPVFSSTEAANEWIRERCEIEIERWRQEMEQIIANTREHFHEFFDVEERELIDEVNRDDH